jgi:hypothetical protein
MKWDLTYTKLLTFPSYMHGVVLLLNFSLVLLLSDCFVPLIEVWQRLLLKVAREQ